MEYTDEIQNDLQKMIPKLSPKEYLTYIELYTYSGLDEAYNYIKETTNNSKRK